MAAPGGVKAMIPTGTTRFFMTVNTIGDLQLSKVGGLEFQGKVKGQDKPVLSGKGGVTIRQINSSGYEGMFTLQITTLLSVDSKSSSVLLHKWFKSCMPKDYETTGGKIETSKYDATIYIYNSASDIVAQWDLKATWPKDYSIGDLDVAGDGYLEETYTLVCENMKITQKK